NDRGEIFLASNERGPKKFVPKLELGNEENTLFLFRSGRYRGRLGYTRLGLRGLGRRFFLWGSR
ncbi:MAG: hypothetical protein COS90_01115, partial [Deltaproteobacteria bacterium CG07_land_8_20_14_0_80_60_11]